MIDNPSQETTAHRNFTSQEIKSIYEQVFNDLDAELRYHLNSQNGVKWREAFMRFLSNKVRDNGTTAQREFKDFLKHLENEVSAVKSDEMEFAKSKLAFAKKMFDMLFPTEGKTASAQEKPDTSGVNLSSKEKAFVDIFKGIARWVWNRVCKVMGWKQKGPKEHTQAKTESSSRAPDNVIPLHSKSPPQDTSRAVAEEPPERLAA